MELTTLDRETICVGATLTYGDMEFEVVAVRPNFRPPAGFDDTVCLISPTDGSGFRGGLRTPWGMMYSTKIVESSKTPAPLERTT